MEGSEGSTEVINNESKILSFDNADNASTENREKRFENSEISRGFPRARAQSSLQKEGHADESNDENDENRSVSEEGDEHSCDSEDGGAA